MPCRWKTGNTDWGRYLDMVEFIDNAACVLFNQKFVLGAPITVTPDNIVAARYLVAQLLRRYFPIVHTGEADPQLLKNISPKMKDLSREMWSVWKVTKLVLQKCSSMPISA